MADSLRPVVGANPTAASPGPQSEHRAVKKKKVKKKKSLVVPPPKAVEDHKEIAGGVGVVPSSAPSGPVASDGPKKARKTKTKKKVLKKSAVPKKTPSDAGKQGQTETKQGEEEKEKDVQTVRELEIDDQKKFVADVQKTDVQNLIEMKHVPDVQKVDEQMKHVPDVQKVDEQMKHVPDVQKVDEQMKHVPMNTDSQRNMSIASESSKHVVVEKKSVDQKPEDELKFDGIDAILPLMAPKLTPGDRMAEALKEEARRLATERQRLHEEAVAKQSASALPVAEPEKLPSALDVKIRKFSEGKKVKDVHALFNVVVSVGGSKRSSRFFLDSEEGDDRLKVSCEENQTASVEVTLMGDGKPVGMQMFSSIQDALRKTIALRSGRYCFEVAMSETVATSSDSATVLTNRFVLIPVSEEREKVLKEVKTTIEDSRKPAPPDLQKKFPKVSGSSAVFLEHNVRRWASLACDLTDFCNLIVASKYHPAQSLMWRTPSGNHLLHLACLAGHEQCISMLVLWPQLYPFAAKNSSGASILHFAVCSGNLNAVALILKALTVQEVDSLMKSTWVRKTTPLHLAAMLGHSLIVEELLRFKSSVPMEAFDHTGSTPLIWASYVGAADVTVVLCDAGASFSAEDEDGSTALTLAIKRGHENVVQVIANHPKGCFSVAHSISATSLDTALWIGMAKGPRMAKIIAETMTKCVSQGDEWTNPELYKVDFKFGEHENTLLHRACMVFADDYCCNLVNELKQFLRLSPNAHKQTALHFALAMGKIKTCSALLSLDGDSDAPDAYDNTLLHYALTGASIDWLCKNKPDAFKSISARNWIGLTPLMHAFAIGSKDGIAAMVAIGGDATEVLMNGQSCVALLEERSKSALLLPFSSADKAETGSFRIPLPNIASRKSLADVSRRGSQIRKVDKSVIAQVAKARW